MFPLLLQHKCILTSTNCLYPESFAKEILFEELHFELHCLVPAGRARQGWDCIVAQLSSGHSMRSTSICKVIETWLQCAVPSWSTAPRALRIPAGRSRHREHGQPRRDLTKSGREARGRGAGSPGVGHILSQHPSEIPHSLCPSSSSSLVEDRRGYWITWSFLAVVMPLTTAV